MATTQAAVFYGPDDGIEFEAVEIPELESGSVLARIQLASICGTDVHMYEGERTPPLPIIQGHEAMGVVEALGPGVETDAAGQPLSEGDRITWSYLWTCGECYHCENLLDPVSCENRIAMGITIGCDDSPHLNGGFAEHMYLRPGMDVFKVPDSLSNEVVAPANCAVVTMVHVTERADVGLGEDVVIQGCGPLGLYGSALSQERGAGQVIVTDMSPERLSIAEEFGVDHTINITDRSPEDVAAEVEDLTNGIGADVVIEATGVPDAIPAGLEMLREGGRYVTIGPIYQGAEATIDMFDTIFRRKTIIGIARNTARHMDQALGFLEQNQDKYPFDEVVGATFDLEDIEEAYETVGERKVMRAGLEP